MESAHFYPSTPWKGFLFSRNFLDSDDPTSKLEMDPANSRVYVTCRPIFSGTNALVRKQKKVKELIDRSRPSLRPLLQDIGEAKLIESLRYLLEKRIFESELRAKVEFPELFRPSPLRDVQRQASEIDAARSTTEALDEIASQEGDDERQGIAEEAERGGVVVEVTEPDELPPALDDAELEPPTELVAEKRILLEKVPSLYPSYIPYHTQHLILTRAQQVLEECCFDFAAASMPSVLREKRWDCPAAVELTQWTKIFRTAKGKARLAALSTASFTPREVQMLLIAVANLRHTAVHRLPTTAKGIGQLLEAAVKLAQLLQDNLRAAQLDQLLGDVKGQIKAMELNKNVLEDTVSGELQTIQRQREALDRAEKELIQRMLKDDMDNKALIGQLLEDSVRRIFERVEEKEEEEKVDKDEENEEKEEEEDKKGKRKREAEEDEGGTDKDFTENEFPQVYAVDGTTEGSATL